MNESEETENDLSFNFLDFVDHELEDTVNDENSTSFVDLVVIIPQTQAMPLLEPFVTIVVKKLASRT